MSEHEEQFKKDTFSLKLSVSKEKVKTKEEGKEESDAKNPPAGGPSSAA